jgi:hypothetical protein
MSEETKRTEPPFDGQPCPMCPVELRNLAAVAHNVVVRWRAGRWSAHADGIDELERALKAVQAMTAAHFANEAHSHPPRRP